ncbi:MAG: sulfatase-like hydrolase/transferase [Planctomycetaceae bacterium]
MANPLPFLLTCSLLVVAQAAVMQADDRPNFVFILTDDQSPETLACYGNTVCETPHLDRLAREGMVLHDAHHMGANVGAVCTPSRTMIMTGRTVWHLPKGRAKRNAPLADDLDEAATSSLPALFNAAGYDTFRTCKQGNSFEAANRLFTVRKDATRRDGTPQGGSEWHGDQVIDYLDGRAKSRDEDPFLIYFGFSHPHDPRNPLPELAAKYGAVERDQLAEINPDAPPLPANWLPEHPFHHGHPGLRDEEHVGSVGRRRDEAIIRNELAREYACIENIDRQIGRLLAKLEELGELDSTYIVFTSDHGIAVGRHGLLGKQNLYEHTWRVPMIVRGPGIEPGSSASGYVYLLDVLPTLCDYAGIRVPSSVEGISFRPVLEGKQQRIRDVLYGVYCGGTKPGIRSVKSGDWKLIEYDVMDGAVRETQLFNLKQNPHEFLVQHRAAGVFATLKHEPTAQQVNLAGDPAHAETLARMRGLLAEEMRRLDDPYTLSEPKVVSAAE